MSSEASSIFWKSGRASANSCAVTFESWSLSAVWSMCLSAFSVWNHSVSKSLSSSRVRKPSSLTSRRSNSSCSSSLSLSSGSSEPGSMPKNSSMESLPSPSKSFSARDLLASMMLTLSCMPGKWCGCMRLWNSSIVKAPSPFSSAALNFSFSTGRSFSISSACIACKSGAPLSTSIGSAISFWNPAKYSSRESLPSLFVSYSAKCFPSIFVLRSCALAYSRTSSTVSLPSPSLSSFACSAVSFPWCSSSAQASAAPARSAPSLAQGLIAAICGR
mmetsp:Transcript_115884/g.324105  ORF Transcript_115884/g.324105 Transcript_115884/m.324105 type:complete len:274 (-) Transcript_115884:32-853(-)